MSERLQRLAAAGDRKAMLALWREQRRTGCDPDAGSIAPEHLVAALGELRDDAVLPLPRNPPGPMLRRWVAQERVVGPRGIVEYHLPDDHSIHIWDFADGQSLATFRPEPRLRTVCAIGHRHVLAPVSRRRVILANTHDGGVRTTLTPFGAPVFVEHLGSVSTTAIHTGLSSDGALALLGFVAGDRAALAVHATEDGAFLGSTPLPRAIDRLVAVSATDAIVTIGTQSIHVQLEDPFVPTLDPASIVGDPVWCGDRLAHIGSRGVTLRRAPGLEHDAILATPTSPSRVWVGAGGKRVAAECGERVLTWARTPVGWTPGPVSQRREPFQGIHPRSPVALFSDHLGGAWAWHLEEDAFSAVPLGATHSLDWTRSGDLFLLHEGIVLLS